MNIKPICPTCQSSYPLEKWVDVTIEKNRNKYEKPADTKINLFEKGWQYREYLCPNVDCRATPTGLEIKFVFIELPGGKSRLFDNYQALFIKEVYETAYTLGKMGIEKL